MKETFVKMALDAWNSYLKRGDELFASLSDEQLQQQIRNGKNSGVYLLGHLAAEHDELLPLLGIGNCLHPELIEIFLNSPDNSGHAFPPVADLRKYWKDVNALLSEKFKTWSAEDWFQRHTKISAEDFIKEPHRNKLNVMMNRTNHLSWHLGQIVLLKK